MYFLFLSRQPFFLTCLHPFFNTGSSGYLESGVASWVNEKKDYTYSTNSCSGVCGHYTQVNRFSVSGVCSHYTQVNRLVLVVFVVTIHR